MNLQLEHSFLYASIKVSVKGFITRREDWSGEISYTEYLILETTPETYIAYNETWGIKIFKIAELDSEYDVAILEQKD